MKMYYNTVTDTAGNIVNGATVTVYEDGGAVATIYDYLGSPISNPFQSGLNRSEGEIEFAAASGIYDIKIVNGLETDWIRNEVLFDPSDPGEIGATTPAKLTCTEFTSNGIDDNATGERMQIADSLLSIGAAGASYPVAHAADDQNIELVGGNASGNGGAVKVYGGSHATKAGDIELLSGGNICVQWDENNGEFVIYTGTGSKSEAARFYAGGSAKIANTLTIGGGAILAADAVSYSAAYGGNVSDNGGGIILYGGSHATLPGDVYLQSGANPFLSWDESAGTLVLSSGVGSKTAAATVNSSQVVQFSQTPNVGGDDVLTATDIGVTVQGYDADTAKTDAANTWTQDQTIEKVAPTLTLNATLSDAVASFEDSGTARAAIYWDRSADALTIVQYDTDGTTPRAQIDLTETGVVNVSVGELQIAGSAAVSAANTITLTNKTLTSPVINTSVSGTAILDEDNMTSNSDTKLATQQSIKAYVDSSVAGGISHRGALVYDTTNDSISSGTTTTLLWNSEIYDTDSIHSTVSNTSRLTVPSGVSKVKVSAQILWEETASSQGVGERAIYIHKNGGVFAGMPASIIAAGSTTYDTCHGAISAVLEVSPGDYFECKVAQYSGVSINVDHGDVSWFNMEIIQ